MIDHWDISHEIFSRWMSLDLTDDKSTLVHVTAWYRQATSHYLSQCWSRSLSPYGITRPQWVNTTMLFPCRSRWSMTRLSHLPWSVSRKNTSLKRGNKNISTQRRRSWWNRCLHLWFGEELLEKQIQVQILYFVNSHRMCGQQTHRVNTLSGLFWCWRWNI